jgi:hypothetical protein
VSKVSSTAREDGWTIMPDEVERERSLLDDDAQVIKHAIASTDSLVAATPRNA